MTDKYVLMGPNGAITRRDTYQGAAESMADYTADEQKHMFIVFQRDDD